MNTSMTTLVAPATTPPALAPVSAAPDGEAEGAAFSHCLEEACAPPPAPAAKAKPSTTTQGKSKAVAPPATDTAATPNAAKALADDAPADKAALALAAPQDDDTTVAPVDLAALLPGWAPPAATQAAAHVTAADSEAPAQPDGAPLAATATHARSAVSRDVAEAHAADVGVPTAVAPAAAAPNRAEPAALHLDTPRKPATAEPPPRASTEPGTAPVALPPALMPPAHTQPSIATPTPSAALAPPPQHPDFAPALATQVRWWADAGVQQAQLTLNPAEMGPVAVRIVVTDAHEARIDFSADLAATRQALEASLPVLAAALDESGLKLTGGGVHDGASQRQGAWEHARAQAAKHATLPAVHDARVNERTPARTGIAARGIVDLVA